MLTRRSALFVLATPAIVRAASLMPVRALAMPITLHLRTNLYVDADYTGQQFHGTRDHPWTSFQAAWDYLQGHDLDERRELTIHVLHGDIQFPA